MKPNVTIISDAFLGSSDIGRVSFYESQNAYMCLTAGNTAKSTIIYDGKTYDLQYIPSGIVCPNVICCIGPDVIIDPSALISEIIMLQKAGINITPKNLIISHEAYIMFPFHKDMDILYKSLRNDNTANTSDCGLGPCYSDNYNGFGIQMRDLKALNEFWSNSSLEARAYLYDENFMKKLSAPIVFYNTTFDNFGMRVKHINATELHDVFVKYAEVLAPYIRNFELYLNEALELGKKIVIEGTYTNNLHIGPKYVKEVIGVCKSYNDIFEDKNCFCIDWLDLSLLNQIKYTAGYTCLSINRIDKIGLIGQKFGNICVKTQNSNSNHVGFSLYHEFEGGWDTTGCKTYGDLPEKAREFIEFIEKSTGLPAKYIGIGPDNADTIIR